MKKKRILTEEQFARQKNYQVEYYQKNKEKKKISHANWYQENKAQNKIYKAEWRANRSDEKVAEDKAKAKINKTKWYQENKEQKKITDAKWVKANPEYAHKHDLGYWVVYLIKNYNGLGDTYCGQTGNVYNRMKTHKSDGTLNSDKYELIKQCETYEDALEFEAYMHEQGFHGSARTEKGK